MNKLKELEKRIEELERRPVYVPQSYPVYQQPPVNPITQPPNPFYYVTS